MDAARDIAADAQADAFVDVPGTDAPDLVLDDAASDTIVAMDVPPIDVVRPMDVVDATSLPDIVDTFDAGAPADVHDASDSGSSDVQATCYGIGGGCSPMAPCCSGLTCGSTGTCGSSCLTLYATCSGGGCCPGLNCQFGFCRPSTCQDLHQSCASPGACCTGLACTGGTCGCAIGETMCMLVTVAYCANLQVNASNCGSCGHRCAAGQTCTSGVCH